MDIIEGMDRTEEGLSTICLNANAGLSCDWHDGDVWQIYASILHKRACHERMSFHQSQLQSHWQVAHPGIPPVHLRHTAFRTIRRMAGCSPSESLATLNLQTL